MNLDWIDRLLTPCPQHLREMGYLRELLNLRQCYRWWKSAWAPHLERTRAVIRAAIDQCPRRRKAVILGSGLLHDVPLAELADAFQEVILVDLLHPFRTRWKIRRLRNVRTLAADVTGAVEGVHRVAYMAGEPLPRATPNLFEADQEVDLVASVNLLSQLPCLPVRYLRSIGVHSNDAIEAFARNVIEAHLAYLRRLPGVVALIADFASTTLDRDGEVLKEVSTLYGVPLPWSGANWIWRLIPLRRSPPYHSEWLKVAGVANIQERG